MKHYVGIDLGTTNSAICTFDGETTRLYKSPDQYDVTPSAIFIDKRNNKYVGRRAYLNAARSPENAAILFKRFMGTSTPIKLLAVGMTMTPEECSAEVLRVLFGYLPDEIRNESDTGTVITVPAAFNQMQKDATMAAAEMAGLGKVALMQEPVAAVMSVMKHREGDGMFLVYDLGGGTLDIAIAESIKGRISLLSHGGIAMCGGRDFDRVLVDRVVKPWLIDRFDLPENFSTDPRYTSLRHMASWAAENAKIELSLREEAVISMDDSEMRVRDESGNDIYLDIPISRGQFDHLIAEMVAESIQAAREAIEKAQLSPHDIGRVVFVGGPTRYPPLRDKVAFELGIAASTEVDPMTAVAEGAAVFAESIDWSNHNRKRKSGRGELSASGELDLSFGFTARTPESKARIIAKIRGSVAEGTAFQIDSLDTGSSSGRAALKDGAVIDVALGKGGENTFKVFVFDGAGGPVRLASDRIVITRTAAQIDAIPASQSIGLEAREKVGGRLIVDFLVREGDQLPKKGQRVYRAEESLRAGAPGSIKFKVWEGEIDDPISDNRFIGMFEIKGSDFEDGVISKGAELLLNYEVTDAGNMTAEVTVASIGASFHSGRNFYSRQAGQIDYTLASDQIRHEAERLEVRLNETRSRIEDPRLDDAQSRVSRAKNASGNISDPESAKQAMDVLQEAKLLLAKARRSNSSVIQRAELEKTVELFNGTLRKFATPAETVTFDNLAITAEREIGNAPGNFDLRLNDLRVKNLLILWRQDWFVIDRFKWIEANKFMCADPSEHARLCAVGRQALQSNDLAALRNVVFQLNDQLIGQASDDELIASSNILVG